MNKIIKDARTFVMADETGEKLNLQPTIKAIKKPAVK
jgi:hypothetical protein